MTDFLITLQSYTCGTADSSLQFEEILPKTISTIIGLMKVIIPILVVFFGLLDLGKAVMSQKEDDIKKNQGLLIKRLIIAVLVFFVISLVQFLVSLVGGSDSEFWGCFNCFVNYEIGEKGCVPLGN